MFNELAHSTYHKVIGRELEAAVIRYTEYWEDVIWQQLQENKHLVNSIEQLRISVIVLSSALVESVINFYLCTKSSAERFKKLDRKSLLKKWTEVPKEFISAYSLSDQSDLRRDLSRLINRRNVIVHPKPYLSIDGDDRHKGNEPESAFDENDFIGRCVSLPRRLIEHLLKFDPDAYFYLHDIAIHCSHGESKFSWAQWHLKQMLNIPRNLILEIMGQGYERRKAHFCAAMLGHGRKRNEAGELVVWLGHQETVILKPLKFFDEIADNEEQQWIQDIRYTDDRYTGSLRARDSSA